MKNNQKIISMKPINKLFLISIVFIICVFLISLISAEEWNFTLNTNLLAYYKLNNTSSNDSLGTYNLTAVNTPTFNINGVIGGSAHFDSLGENDYFQSAYIGNGHHDFSISGWINWSGENGRHNEPLVLGSGSLGLLNAYRVDGEQNLYLGNGLSSVLLTSTLTAGKWYHLSLIYDSESDKALGYLDGINIANLSGIITFSSEGFKVGGTGSGLQTWDGEIDEVGIWERVLTPNDILHLYNSGLGITYLDNTTYDYVNVVLSTPLTGSIIRNSSIILITNYTSKNPLSNATYYIWSSNGALINSTTISITYTNITSLQVFDLNYLDYSWNVRACNNNGLCSMAATNSTFKISPFNVKSIHYNNNTFETQRESFYINITANSNIKSVTAKLWLNNISNSGTVTDGIAGYYKSNNTLDMPLVSIDKQIVFKWSFDLTLEDNTFLQQNTSDYLVNVNKTYFTYCNGTINTQFINFTTKSAENPFPIINATFKSSWEWWLGNGDVRRNYTYEDVSETNSSWKFCMNHNQTFNINSHIEYDNSFYALNNYYIKEGTINNNTLSIDLHLLNSSKATLTILIVRDAAQQPIEDVITHIQLYDVGTGTFYTIGMAKSDFKGEDIAYLNWYNSLYKFTVIKDGEVIKITNTSRITDTPLYLDIDTSTTFEYDKFKNFAYNLYYNNATKLFVLSFTKPSGLIDQGCLRVIKRSAENDTQICLTCETSSSATIYCNIATAGNGTFIGTFYATGSYKLIDWITTTVGGNFADDIYDLLGNADATFYAFLFSGIIVAISFVSPVFGIVGLILGVIAGGALGFAPINFTEMIGIILVGGFIIWIIKK